jgi:5-methylcytosine-specific restriction endonuclease McrA
VSGRDKTSNWAIVQRYYDLGHTREECMRRFGFSKRAWTAAVDHGEVKPRAPGTPAVRRTRLAVKEGLAKGMQQSEIAKQLGVRKSTVAYHARGLGYAPDDKFNRRYDWEAVQRAHDSGMRASECVLHFGFSNATWCSAVKRGDIVPRPHLIPLDQLLVRGRRTGRDHLKGRLLRAGLKENRCERCGISDWQGEPLNMQLHHRNGDGRDNRLENIEFLCANCHSQTENWGGRNGHHKPGRRLTLVKGGKGNDRAA